MPGCAYTICWYGRIEISCTFPCGSPCRTSRVSPCTPSVQICCIRLLCDWSFRLCHFIAYIYCFVASYLFSLWYDFIIIIIIIIIISSSSSSSSIIHRYIWTGVHSTKVYIVSKRIHFFFLITCIWTIWRQLCRLC